MKSTRITRRDLLRAGTGAAALGAVGGLTLARTDRGATTTLNSSTARDAATTFTHPGMVHNAGDINRAKVRVAAGDQPWLGGWDRLVANSHSASTWTPNPQATVIRGGTGENYSILYNDIAAAYQNALRWQVGGTEANAACAADILNAWSAKLTTVTGDADRFLAAGIYGWQFANVAELMRDYSAFDLARFQTMMVDIFYPINNDFLTNHNGACITNYWADWDLCSMASIIAIGILTDDTTKFDQAVTYFQSGAGNGSITHAVPYLYTDSSGYGLGQWQESGRDQGHTVMGMGQAGALCEMAWNQGTDLYSYDDRRFMQGAQYVAKYNIGDTVPFTTYHWGSGDSCAQESQTTVSSASRGITVPVWDRLYYHYARRLYLDVPYIATIAANTRPEGGGGDYGTTSGGYDDLGFGTLMYAK